MSARDELFAVLERAIVGKTSIVGAREAAQAVIDAGWRPPMRVISTVEELEALPVGSVVLDTGPERQLSNAPVVLCKTGWGDWQNLGDDPLRRWWSKEIIPVAKGNVLLCVWEPEGEA